jgi:Fe2+ or Zn2+ uptake regulation protein
VRGTHIEPPRADGEALAALRARGGRLTRQRSLIWQTLVDSMRTHLSAAEICAAVKGKAPELHRATVYRTVDALVGEGLLLRTDLGTDRSYYELPGAHRHHHVVCKSCGAVAHIHDRDIGPVLDRVEAASGYAVGDLELTFPGRCPECAGKGSRS